MTTTLLDSVWLAVCGMTVFLMQAGFLCLEAGSTRSKNRINITVKNLADLGLSVLIFWAVGYGVMFGTTIHGLIGSNGFWPNLGEKADLWIVSFFFFQAMFCSTAVTILSGAAAERMSFKGYLAIALLISGFIYPVFGHWVWHGIDQGQSTGWLAQKGFIDFAGSTVVHSLGGWCSLATLLVIGPRLGRFSAKRDFGDMASADTPIAFLGVMLLWFGWFGFNGGSNLVFDTQVIHIIVNTLLAGSAGMAAMILDMLIRQQPVEIKPTMNGVLAGLVAVTSGCHAFSSVSALFVGAVGSLLMLWSTHWLEKWRIDDVVGAIPVHLVAGAWGTLAVGLFGNLAWLGTGLGRLSQIKVQIEGILACGIWTFSLSLVGLLVVQWFIPLRVSPKQEFMGLNISEHGAKSSMDDVYSVMKHHANTGNLGRRVKETSFTEAGRVGHWYNQVLDALETAIATNNAIVQTAADGIVTITSPDLTIESTNPAMVELFGYGPGYFQGQSVQSLFPSTNVLTAVHFAQIAKTTEPWPMVGKRHNGKTFPLEITASESLVKAHAGSEQKSHRIITLFLKDISARQQAAEALVASREQAQAKADDLEKALKTQAQLIQRERIAGQEQLVAGIAHEINNPVNFIHGNLDHAQRYIDDLIHVMAQYRQHHHDLSPNVRSQLEDQLEDLDIDFIAEDVPKLFASMKTGTNRIRTIVEELRVFSRHDETALKTIDLHTSLESTLAVLAHQLTATDRRPAIQIVRQYDEQLPQVTCYASALNRAILNILNNAVEAFNTVANEGKDECPSTPTITLQTHHKQDHVIIKLSNNGPHISETVKKKLFDPFFTTQPVGKGTGLGCTISYQVVVEQHRGQLMCFSEPGKGVCFQIELPITQMINTDSQEDGGK